MRAFDELTPAGRARRLRRLGERALAHYPVAGPRLSLLSESFNTLFRVVAGDARYVLRVGAAQRVHAPGAAAAEQRWTDQLATQGVLVPRVVATTDGSPSVTVTDGAVTAPRECTLLTWIPGRTLVRPVSTDDLIAIAVLTARLHEASPPTRTCPHGVLDAGRAWQFDVPQVLDRVGSPDGAVLRAALARAQHAIDELWSGADDPPRVIHSDLTPRNVVRARTGVVPIDFQDLSWAHVEQDLANTLFGATAGIALDTALPVFRSGYERVRPWPGGMVELLPHLVAARRLTMVNLAVLLQRPGLAEYLRTHAAALRGYAAAAD